MLSLAVIIPAAGRSSRFGGGRNKLLEDLAGRAVLGRTLDAFLGRADVAMVVVAGDEHIGQFLRSDPTTSDLLSRRQRLRLCAGGESRAHSVRNALGLVPDSVDWVAVHDAARPLVSQELIERTLAAAVAHGAAAPALAVNLTIKEAAGPFPAAARHTVPRHDLWAMQTPQIMRRADLVAALARCPIPLDRVTDDAQLLELAGLPVWLVAGEERNLKITTATDLAIARILLAGTV